jgi:hypothetical protein
VKGTAMALLAFYYDGCNGAICGFEKVIVLGVNIE